MQVASPVPVETHHLWTGMLEVVAEPTFTIRVHQAEGVTWLSLTGELDADTGSLLEHRLLQAEEGWDGPLAINLEHLTFMDARGLAILEQAKHRASSRCQLLPIVNAQPQVRRLLKLVGRERLLSGSQLPL